MFLYIENHWCYENRLQVFLCILALVAKERDLVTKAFLEVLRSSPPGSHLRDFWTDLPKFDFLHIWQDLLKLDLK